jgi:hypothetical protein
MSEIIINQQFLGKLKLKRKIEERGVMGRREVTWEEREKRMEKRKGKEEGRGRGRGEEEEGGKSGERLRDGGE